MNKTFKLDTKIWQYKGRSAWHFVTIPTDISENIDFYFAHAKAGWGSLKVTVTIGKTSWRTSIFPDRKTNTYLLPIKKSVRVSESLSEDDLVRIAIEIAD